MVLRLLHAQEPSLAQSYDNPSHLLTSICLPFLPMLFSCFSATAFSMSLAALSRLNHHKGHVSRQRHSSLYRLVAITSRLRNLVDSAKSWHWTSRSQKWFDSGVPVSTWDGTFADSNLTGLGATF
ncbi:hypothetical protein DM01DRAFT_83062 [Hesseltinella vesiculosa]|uniref:Uncharacterized protein n=1 Tax=Hesseltinella vesiculosa TaxID=101127 RepID=A0A1X2G5Y2_9FUNG|nr:hypothetical protein DM01DRAFT_83062 [Hesseltinella vesiculosa]